MRTLLCAAAAITISVLTACGSGSGTAVPANIRLVNDTTSVLSLDFNNATTIASVPSDTASAYSSVAPGTYTLNLTTATSNVPVATGSVGLGTGQSYTTIAYLHNTDIQAQYYPDNQAVPSAGHSSLNVYNLSVDSGPVDVYLVAHGAPIGSNASPTFASISYQQLSAATNPSSTSSTVAYDIIVTGLGNASDVRLLIPSPAFASAQQYTLVLTSTTGGGLVNGVLVPQGVAIGASAFHPNTKARVRLLSALPVANALDVGATIGGTALISVQAPKWTPYQPVPGGSTITTLTVAGSAIANPSIPGGTFLAGHDYSILFYGAAGAPLTSVFDDSNQIKDNTASVRVINAAVTGPIGLYVNGSATINNVPYGSDVGVGSTPGVPLIYTGVTPASSPILEVSGGVVGAAYDQTLSGTTSVPLVTGAVKTIFVYDATLPPRVITDR